MRRFWVLLSGIMLLVAVVYGPSWWGQFHYWLYFGKGDEVTKTQAISAGVQAAAAVILLGVTAYYAFVTRRALDAAQAQAGAANATLKLLQEEEKRQRRMDVKTVLFQLEAGIDMIDRWQKRIDSESYDLPDVIEMRPTNFSSSIPNADRIDQIVAERMGAALRYITEAEIDVRIMRDRNPNQYTDSPAGFMITQQTRERLRARAGENLNVARFKLDEARTRLDALTRDEQRRASPTDQSSATGGLV